MKWKSFGVLLNCFEITETNRSGILALALPVLYSFRRCPYAMRARLTAVRSNQVFELREILLKNKPGEMLLASSKGTVPVAITQEGMVIDESLELMLWILSESDPDNWLDGLENSMTLIQQNDAEFKYWLDRYKYHVGYPEEEQEVYRGRASEFLRVLENLLSDNEFLFGSRPNLADVAIFPFVRQFAFVDKDWFDNSAFLKTKAWLDHWMDSDFFRVSMMKFDAWKPGTVGVRFPIKTPD